MRWCCKALGTWNVLRTLEGTIITKSHPGDKSQDLDLNAVGLTLKLLPFSNKFTTISLAL